MTRQSASCRGLDAPSSLRLLALPALTAPLALPALLALLALLALIAATAAATPAEAQSLYGSHESLVRQNLVAQQHDYPYLRTTQEVMQAVESGALVPVRGNEDFELAGSEVSFPYARPEVKTFLEQLAHAYRASCGEPLVVTSMVRPISRQPWNASPISVHPTGMAVDLRRSDRRGCRQWLESTLLALEGEGMVEATREHWPPHYHVAVFPDPLLLPGPIGDPNGVVRVAALATLHGGMLAEADVRSAARSAGENDGEPVARHGRVHVGRSSRTGRLRITQTAPTAITRHSQRSAAAADARIVVHRHGARRGQADPAAQAAGGRRDRQAGATRHGSGTAGRVARAERAEGSTRRHTRSRTHTASRATAAAR
jgi:hypothetical protein